MKPMKLWLTCDEGCGLHSLWAFEPVQRRVAGTNRTAWYAKPGEPIAIRYLCQDGVRTVIGRMLGPDECVRVTLTLKEGW
jgi:hypothetical protein